MEYTNPQFFALIIALIKEARFGEAMTLLLERQRTHLNSSRLYSFMGMVSATSGHAENAEHNFLNAYANSRNPFYLRQLEDVWPQLYDGPLPIVLNSTDFVSFFKQQQARLDSVEYKNISRIKPLLEGQPAEVYPSTLFEEMLLDRGVWIAEDKNIEVIYTKRHHSPLISGTDVLIEKSHEFPTSAYTEDPLFPLTAHALGSTGIISLHSSTCSMMCRRDLLPTQSLEEEGVFIGGLPNTGHYLLDYLPKLETWAQVSGNKDIPIYVCHFSDFYHEMASTLFPEFRFINISAKCSEPTLLHFKHLHVPSYVPAGLGFSALRERARRFGLLKESGRDKMIYLARGEKFRRLQNEAELVERLKQLGLTIIDTMQTTFKELLAYASAADIIVTGVGAQNAYVPFCKPETEYVDIMPDIYLDKEGWQFNERLYTYSQVRLQKVRGKADNSHPAATDKNWLYTCNVNEVEDAIRRSAARKNIKLN